MVLLVTKGAHATVLLHPKCLQFPHPALFPASTGLLGGPLWQMLPVPTSLTKLKAVLCGLPCERRKKAPQKLGPTLPTASYLPCTWSKCCWVVDRTWQRESAPMSRTLYTLYILLIVAVKKLFSRKGENNFHNSRHSLYVLLLRKTK